MNLTDIVPPALEPVPDLGDVPAAVVASTSPRRLALARFLRHRVAVVSLVVLVLILVAAIVLPAFVGHDPGEVDIRALREGPGGGHLLGTDSSGRDVLARLLSGARVSLLIAVVVAICSTTIGLLLGSVAGYFGGSVDGALGRLADIVLSFPTLVVVIMVVAISGPGRVTLILALGLTQWPTAFRVVRGLSLSLRDDESIQGARVLGARSPYVLTRYIVPSVIGPLTVVASLLVAQAILLESALSFLGLGVPQTTPTWGGMLREAQSLTVIEAAPWVWLPPGLAVSVTILAINFVGDGLRDALDARQAL